MGMNLSYYFIPFYFSRGENMEDLSIEEIEVLEDLIKTEIVETSMLKKDVEDDDKEDLEEYIATLKSIQSKLIKK